MKYIGSTEVGATRIQEYKVDGGRLFVTTVQFVGQPFPALSTVFVPDPPRRKA